MTRDQLIDEAARLGVAAELDAADTTADIADILAIARADAADPVDAAVRYIAPALAGRAVQAHVVAGAVRALALDLAAPWPAVDVAAITLHRVRVRVPYLPCTTAIEIALGAHRLTSRVPTVAS